MTEKDKLLQEALQAFKEHNYNGVALMATGAGKGRLMIEIAKLLKPQKILYLCNTVLLRDKMFIDELHKWDAAHLLDNMDLMCYQSACKLKDVYYDLVLGDEFDASLTDVYIRVFKNNNFKYKILVSATLDAQKRRLAAKIAPIIFERTQQQLIKNKVLNNLNFTFIRYNLTAIENKQYINYNKQFVELLNRPRTKIIEYRLNQLQIQRKQFLSSLGSSAEVTKWLLAKLRPKQEKILIFCGLSKQADVVCKHSYHSNNNNIEAFIDFENGTIKEIAVVDKVDRGLNISSIKHIICESLTKSKTKLTQRLGRGMRLDINDTLNAYLLVPYYRNFLGEQKPTIVQEWIISATEDMNLSGAKTIKYEDYK